MCASSRPFVLALGLVALFGLALPAVASVATAQAGGDEREALRQRWQQMDAEERAQLRQNWSRWQSMSKDDRAELRDRHARLDHWKRRLVQGLEEDERERLAPLRGERREREMGRLTRERLRDFADSVPDGLRDSMRERIRHLPPPEREHFFAERVRDEAGRRLNSLLEQWMQEGLIPAEDAARARRQFAEGGPRERLRVVRRLASEYPAGLSLSEDLLQDLARIEDPVEAMRRAQRAHFPPLRPEETARLLAASGVPAADCRRWLRAPEEQRRQLLARWTQEHRIVTPGAMARHLQQRGVPGRRVRAAYRGTATEALGALRGLYREFGIDPLSYEESRRSPSRPPPGPRGGPGNGPPGGPGGGRDGGPPGGREGGRDGGPPGSRRGGGP